MSRSFDDTDRRIIAAAKELFLQQGLHKTELKAIAEKAGFSRETVYRRFRNKDEIAYYVITDIIGEQNALPPREILEKEPDGFRRYEACMRIMCRNYTENVAQVRLLDEFDQQHAAPYPANAAARDFVARNRQGEASLYLKKEFLEQGIADGSVRPMEDLNFVVRCIDHAVIAMCERIIPRQQQFLEEHGFAKEFVWYQLEMMLSYIKRNGG